MEAARRKMFGAIVRFVLVAGMLALPVRVVFAEPEGVGAEPKEESAQEAGQEETSGSAAPDAPQRPLLIDPQTGELIAADEVPLEKVVKLPPGDIEGTVLEADGVTPHAGVKIALIDAKTGEELASTMTADDGKYVLKDVPEGLYMVHVGNPGIGAILQVTAGAEAALLNMVLPGTEWFHWPSWAPAWMQAYPVLGVTVVAAGVIVVVTAAYVFTLYMIPQEVRVSPITP